MWRYKLISLISSIIMIFCIFLTFTHYTIEATDSQSISANENMFMVSDSVPRIDNGYCNINRDIFLALGLRVVLHWINRKVH